MKPTKRVPLAPAQPMPALDEFLRPFHVHFARSEATHALDRYLTGMLTEHPNKNCDTLAQVVPGTSEQSLQGLLTAMRWDEDDLNRQRVQDLLALPTEGDAALVFDDTGFAKQGKSSVGGLVELRPQGKAVQVFRPSAEQLEELTCVPRRPRQWARPAPMGQPAPVGLISVRRSFP